MLAPKVLKSISLPKNKTFSFGISDKMKGEWVQNRMLIPFMLSILPPFFRLSRRSKSSNTNLLWYSG